LPRGGAHGQRPPVNQTAAPHLQTARAASAPASAHRSAIGSAETSRKGGIDSRSVKSEYDVIRTVAIITAHIGDQVAGAQPRQYRWQPEVGSSRPWCRRDPGATGTKVRMLNASSRTSPTPSRCRTAALHNHPHVLAIAAG
jgi:hypothetical protein